jgi:hypothetical protein
MVCCTLSLDLVEERKVDSEQHPPDGVTHGTFGDLRVECARANAPVQSHGTEEG